MILSYYIVSLSPWKTLTSFEPKGALFAALGPLEAVEPLAALKPMDESPL